MPTSDLSSWLCHSRGTHKSALGTIFSAWLEAWQEAWQGEVEEKSAGCWGSAACWQLSWRRPSSTEVIYGNKDKVGYIFSDPWKKGLGLIRCCSSIPLQGRNQKRGIWLLPCIHKGTHTCCSVEMSTGPSTPLVML